MEESHGKGPASHPDPESCVDGRKAGGEALTGAHAGQRWVRNRRDTAFVLRRSTAKDATAGQVERGG